MSENKKYNTHLIEFDELPSTNSYLKENVDKLEDMAAVTADLQTVGRGRLGNSWLADRGMLALSLLFKRDIDSSRLTMTSAVAVCRAVEQLSGVAAGIKWTNDIICDNRKVCGILCESAVKCASDAEKAVRRYVICGMGINVNQSRDFFENAALPNAASLYMLSGRKYDKKYAAELIISQLLLLLDCDFGMVLDEYRDRCVTTGKYVRLQRDGKELTAFARSVADDGCLICENESGEFAVNAGMVRVRGVNGEYV